MERMANKVEQAELFMVSYIQKHKELNDRFEDFKSEYKEIETASQRVHILLRFLMSIDKKHAVIVGEILDENFNPERS